MTYIDGVVVPVKNGNKQAYIDFTNDIAGLFLKHGALSIVDAWGDDVPKGELNSMQSAVLLEEGESVVFSWIRWPDKATRDAGWEAINQVPAMAHAEPPFIGKRMIFGGFEVVAEARAE